MAEQSQRRRRLNERLGAEYIAGAEEEWRKRTGRPMTAAELEWVLPRYPGDVWAPAKVRAFRFVLADLATMRSSCPGG